jgi:DNA polymerase zeta
MPCRAVLCRGSQYRVESMLVRLAHSQNYLAVSPNKEQVCVLARCSLAAARGCPCLAPPHSTTPCWQLSHARATPPHQLADTQVGSQPATEALPLVMEPESRLYSCPVVVLDFQSLYPSMVIAYNLVGG